MQKLFKTFIKKAISVVLILCLMFNNLFIGLAYGIDFQGAETPDEILSAIKNEIVGYNSKVGNSMIKKLDVAVAGLDKKFSTMTHDKAMNASAKIKEKIITKMLELGDTDEELPPKVEFIGYILMYLYYKLLLVDAKYINEFSFTPYFKGEKISFIEDTDTGNYVYGISKTNNKFLIINKSTLEIVKKITVGSMPSDIFVDKENQIAYVANSGKAAISVIDLEKQKKLDDLEVSINPYKLVVGNGKLYATHADDQHGYGIVYDLEKDEEISQIGGYKYPNGNWTLYSGALIEISPDGNYVYISELGLSPGSLYKLDVTGDEPELVLEDDHGDLSSIKDIKISKNGKKMYIVNPGGEVIVWRTSDFKADGTLKASSHLESFVVNENKGYILTYDMDDYQTIFSLYDYSEIAKQKYDLEFDNFSPSNIFKLGDYILIKVIVEEQIYYIAAYDTVDNKNNKLVDGIYAQFYE